MAEQVDEFEELLKKIHPDANVMKDHYSKSSTHHKKALNAIKDDTTGLKEPELVEEFAKYIHVWKSKYSEPKNWEELSEMEQGELKGEARRTLESIAQQQQSSYKDLVKRLQREGLDAILTQYSESQKSASLINYITAAVHENVDADNKGDYWVDKLKEADPHAFGGEDNNVLKANLHNHIIDYLRRYHEKEKPSLKAAEPKAAQPAKYKSSNSRAA